MKNAFDKSKGGDLFLKAIEEVRKSGFHWVAKIASEPSYMTFWIDEHYTSIPSHWVMIDVKMRKKPYTKVSDAWLAKDSFPYF